MSKMLRRISPFSDKCKFTVNHTKINVQRHAIVHVVLVRALNLPKLNKNGKSSDPYCELSLGKKTTKSKTIPKCLNPEWRETFDFNWYKGIDDKLVITPYNKNYGDLPLDDRMGKIEICLNELEVEKTHHLWKDVQNDGQICGKIFVLLTISGTTADESETNLKVIENEIESIQNRWVETYSSFGRASKIDNSVGYLMVKVLEAKGLANTDIIGKSDPFCVIELNNERKVTQTVCNNLTPRWDKVFQFETIKDVCDTLFITVYDEEYDEKHDFLGRLRIPLLSIRNNEQRWYLLKDKNLRHLAPGGNQPRILLDMFFTYNKVLAGINTIQAPREHIHRKEKRPKIYRDSSYSIRRIKKTRTGEVLGRIITAVRRFKNPQGEGKSLPTIHIILFVATYFFELWMVPLALMIPFVYCYLNPEKDTTYHDPTLETDMREIDLDDEISELGISWLKQIQSKMRKFQELNFTVQFGLEVLANMLESIENLFNFSVPFISNVAIIVLLIYTFLLSCFSFRYLILVWIAKDFITTLVGSKRFSVGNFISFMSRVPDNEELEDYRELSQ